MFLAAPERNAAVIILWCIISYSVYWLYSVVLHARYGQTLGKMATHVKVLDVSEQRIPTLRQAFIRDIGYIILNTLSLVYLIYLVASGQYVRGAEVSDIPGRILVGQLSDGFCSRLFLWLRTRKDALSMTSSRKPLLSETPNQTGAAEREQACGHAFTGCLERLCCEPCAEARGSYLVPR